MASNLPPTKAKGGRSHAMQSAPQIDPSLAPVVADVFARFPALARYRDDYAVVRGRPMVPGDDRQLETYAPDESWNPLPGSATTELYNSSVSPAEQSNLIAGDFLHHLADADPRWAAMKAGVVPADMYATRSPQRSEQLYRSRGDEFLMGYLTPDAADDWRNVYTPEQRMNLDKMKAYLTGAILPPTGAR